MRIKYLLLIGIFFSIAFSSFSQKIMVSANHSDAKFFLLNDYDDSEKQELGTGTIELKLEKDSRNRIKITKPGYESVIKEYNKDLKWDKDQKVTIEDRRVEISAEPYDAEIFVD